MKIQDRTTESLAGAGAARASRGIVWALAFAMVLSSGGVGPAVVSAEPPQATGAAASSDESTSTAPSPQWWKGNLHTHSLWSDGNDFPEMIAEWYRTRGYNFLAISDHNILSQGMKWMPLKEIERRAGKSALREYRETFGANWVETRRGEDDDETEVRLKPLDEFRALVEQRGEFLMIQSEEISDRAEGKPVHMNAANLSKLIPPQGGETVREAISNNLRAALEQQRETGREILPHLNHPNFGWAVTAEDLAMVVRERFYEVYNGHPGVNHLGDEDTPSVERIWDLANAIRLVQLHAEPLLGVATDDTHHYHGRGGARPGRGWVMVRSRYLTPERLILAMKRGDFYASSGVTLDEVRFDDETRTLSLEIAPESGATYRTEFIATLPPESGSGAAAASEAGHSGAGHSEAGHSEAGHSEAEHSHTSGREAADPPPLPAADRIGRVMATAEGLNPTYEFRGDELYVRAVVTSSLAAEDPSYEGQQQQAWTQPVGWSHEEQPHASSSSSSSSPGR